MRKKMRKSLAFALVIVMLFSNIGMVRTEVSFAAETAMSISDARAAANETVVTIEGIVTSSSGIFVQDDTGGINIFAPDAELSKGDYITATGKRDEYNGVKQLNRPEITVNSSNNSLPAPKVITISEIGASNEGERVKIDSTTVGAVDFGGSTVFYDGTDESDEISAYKMPEVLGLQTDDVVNITAIVTQFNGTYQLHIAEASDVEKIGVKSIEEARSTSSGAVTVNGIVTSTRGSTFIQDDSAGINLYNKTSGDDFTVGDIVEVTGTPSEYNNLKQIGDYEVKVLTSDQPLPSAPIITIDAIDESYEGERIKIENTTIGAINTSGGTQISDGTNEITLWKMPEVSGLSEGDTIHVNAIVSQFKDNYQLHVAQASDIEILEPVVTFPTIEEIREETLDSEVTARGYVTAKDGSNVYLEDETAGITLYSQLDDTDYKVGDFIEVKGTLLEYKGLLEISDYSVKVVESKHETPVPYTTSDLTTIGEAQESTRVLVQDVSIGETNKYGETTITDSNGETFIAKNVPEGYEEGRYDLFGNITYSFENYKMIIMDSSHILPASTTETISIQEAMTLDMGTNVSVKGVVTHTESSSNLYIQDQTTGVNLVAGEDVSLSDYSIGDVLLINSVIDEDYGLKVVSVSNQSDLEVLATDFVLPSYKTVELLDLAHYQDELVEVPLAKLIATDEYSLYFEDLEGNSEDVYHAKASNYDSSNYTIGQWYSIKGVASIYRSSPQIKLVNGDDIVLQEAPQDPNADKPIIYNVTPGNGVIKNERTFEISAKIEKTVDDIDPESIELVLDGTVLSHSYDAETMTVSYDITEDLGFGDHDLSLTVADINGQTMEKEWYFTIKEKDVVYDFFYGVPHSHTSYSDGKGTPTEAYEFAYDQGLDWLWITDHSNWLDGVDNTLDGAGGPEYNESTDQFEAIEDSEWYKTGVETEAFNAAHDDFLAMRGFEMTFSDVGHLNVIDSTNYVEAKKQMPDLNDFYNWVKETNATEDTLGAFNHPNWPSNSFNNQAYVPEMDRSFTMMEIGNGAPPYSYARAEEQFIRALDNGWHIGATNGQDNHTMNWGEPDNLTAIVSEDLSKESIKEAVNNRRIYSTETRDLELTVKANDFWMGSIVDVNQGENLNFTIDAYDPDDAIKEVQIMTNGGEIILSKNFDNLNQVNWNPTITVPGGANWYVVKVIHDNNKWGVASPIFTPEADDDVKFTKLLVSPDTTLPGSETTIEATVSNMGVRNAENVEVRFYHSEVSEENLIDSITVDEISAGQATIFETTWVPETHGEQKILAEITPIPGVTTVTEINTTINVVKANGKVIMVDAYHDNYDVPGGIGEFTALMRNNGYSVVMNHEEIIEETLEGVDLLLINKHETGSEFSVSEEDVIANWVKSGGSLLLSSKSNYSDNPTLVNPMLEKMGSNIRFNDDNVYETVDSNYYSGGMVWSMYSYNLPETESGLNENIEAIRMFSSSSLVNSEAEALVNNPASGLEILVAGNATSYNAYVGKQTGSIDNYESTDNAEGLIPEGTSVEALGEGYVYATPENGKGEDIPMTAKENVGEGKLLVTGKHYFSDFEIGNEVSNTAFTIKTIDWLTGLNSIQTIEEVKATAKEGDYVTIQGKITVPEETFYDVLYVQDETSGVALYGNYQDNSNDYVEGTEVIAKGKVEFFEGEMEIVYDDFPSSVFYIGQTGPVEVTELSTYEAMQPEHTGKLIQVKGKVTEVNDKESYFKVSDGSAEAYIHVDGYVGAEMSRFSVDDIVGVTGLGSIGAAGPRLRVRGYDDLIFLEEEEVTWREPVVEEDDNDSDSGSSNKSSNVDYIEKILDKNNISLEDITAELAEESINDLADELSKMSRFKQLESARNMIEKVIGKAIKKDLNALNKLNRGTNKLIRNVLRANSITYDIAAIDSTIERINKTLESLVETAKANGLENATRDIRKELIIKSNEVETSLSKDVLEKLKKNDMNLVIETDETSMSINVSDMDEIKVRQEKLSKDDIPTRLSLGNKEVRFIDKNYDFMVMNTSDNGEENMTQFNDKLHIRVDVSDVKDTNQLSVYSLNEETETWEMVTSTVEEGFITFDTSHLSQYSVVKTDVNYEDIENHWAETIIEKSVSRGLLEGFNTGNFKPDQEITRAEFAVMIVNMLGLSNEKSDGEFTDISYEEWYANAVNTAKKVGIVKGVGNGKFMPDAYVSRQDMATMINRAYEEMVKFEMSKTDKTFVDQSKISTYAKEGVEGCVAEGIIEGYSDQSFKPLENATRAEAIKMVLTLFEIE